MDLEQTQAIDFGAEFDNEDETDDEEATRIPVAHLKVLANKEFQEKVFDIFEGDNVIGRHETACNVWIPLQALSREHACIEVKGDAHFIYDKGSRNKTRRGKAILKPDARYELITNTSLTFGDVEAVYYIGDEIKYKSSDAESECFQTASEMESAEEAAAATMLVEEDDGSESDGSVDLLQPTQAYHGGRTLNIAPDSDDDDEPANKPNVTVQDTPAPPRRQAAMGTTAMSTLVLPESDTDEEEDRRKAVALQGLQTQAVADSQEDEEERNSPMMFGATQAYVMESDPEDDDTTDDENSKGDVSAAIFAAETQAFTNESDDKKADEDDRGRHTFVADSDEEDKDIGKAAVIVEEDTEGEDENVDMSHIFAASTLACDLTGNDDEEDANVDDATQAFVSEEKDDDNAATQMVPEDDATQVVEDVGKVASRRIHKTEEEATQLVELEDSCENIATQCLEDGVVAMVTDGPTLAVTEDATVAVTTDDATMAITEETTMAITEEATMAITEEATMAITEEATMAITEEATMAITEEATMAVATEEATMAVTDVATVAIAEDATMAIAEDATMAIAEDATMAVTDVATVAITEDATMAIEPTVAADQAICEDDATQALFEDATVAVTEEEATQVIDEVTHFEDEATQVIEAVPADVTEKASDKSRGVKGRPGRKTKAADKTIQVTEDTTTGEEEATQVIEDVSTEVLEATSDKAPGGSVRPGRRSKAAKATLDTQSKVGGHVAVSPGVTGKSKGGKGRSATMATETAVEEATQVIDDAAAGSDEASQVIEEVVSEVAEKSKGRKGRPGRKSVAKGKTEEATRVVDNTTADNDEATQIIEEIVTEFEEKSKGRKGRPLRKSVAKSKSEEDATEVVANSKAGDGEAAQGIHEMTTEVVEKSKSSRGRPGRKSVAKGKAEEEATQMVEDSKTGDEATQVIEETVSEITTKAKGGRGRPTRKSVAKGKAEETSHDDESTQVVDDGHVSTEDPAETLDKTGRGRKGTAREITEEKSESGGEEATQVYGMSPRRGRTKDNSLSPERRLDKLSPGRGGKSSPGRRTSSGQVDHGEEPATQVYCMEEEEDKEGTQVCEEEEDNTPPLTEEQAADSEEIVQKAGPVIPIPSSSPHKSALASPERRKKSPSPKRVKFAVASQSSESSESTVGEDKDQPGPSEKGRTATRSKVMIIEVKGDAEVKGKKGRRSLPASTTEADTVVVSRSSRGRRSLPAIESEKVVTSKKGGGRKGKVTLDDIEEVGGGEQEAEPSTAGRRGGRSVRSKDKEETVEVKGKGRKSTTGSEESKEEVETSAKEVKGRGRGRKSVAVVEDGTIGVKEDVMSTEDSRGKDRNSAVGVESKGKSSGLTEVTASTEEVKGQGRGRRSIQAGGSGDTGTGETSKNVKLVKSTGGKSKIEESTEKIQDKTETDESPPVQVEEEPKEELKGRTSGRGRKLKQTEEVGTAKEAVNKKNEAEAVSAEAVIEKRGRRSKQLVEDKDVKEETGIEEKSLAKGGRGTWSKLKQVDENDKKSKKPVDVLCEGEDEILSIPSGASNSKIGKMKEMKVPEENNNDADKTKDPVTSTSRGGRRSKTVNIPDVEPEKEKNVRTSGGSGKKGVSEDVTSEEVGDTAKETGPSFKKGRKSKLEQSEAVQSDAKMPKVEVEPPKPRRGGRGKKAEEASQKSNTTEADSMSVMDPANMSGISERKPRGRGKQVKETVSVESRTSSRGRGKKVETSALVDNVESVIEKSNDNSDDTQSEATNSRRTKARGGGKVREESVSKGKGKTNKEESVSKAVEDSDSQDSVLGKVVRNGRKKAGATTDEESQEDKLPQGRKAGRGKRAQDSLDKDVEETPAKKAKGGLVPGTPTQSKQVLAIGSPSLRRKSMDPKPRVMFTGMLDEQGQKIVKDLGGELVSSVHECTHLVTDKIRRTVKLLCCLARGVPIVLPTWLDSCKHSGMFVVDMIPYLVRDTATEKQYKFSLQRSLDKASQACVLAGYQVHVTKSVRPDPSQMKDIVECAGAKYLESMPRQFEERMVVVSCNEDQKMCEVVLKVDIPVVNAEFVLTGILQQEVNLDSYRIFHTTKKRSADTVTGGSSKRRKR